MINEFNSQKAVLYQPSGNEQCLLQFSDASLKIDSDVFVQSLDATSKIDVEELSAKSLVLGQDEIITSEGELLTNRVKVPFNEDTQETLIDTTGIYSPSLALLGSGSLIGTITKYIDHEGESQGLVYTGAILGTSEHGGFEISAESLEHLERIHRRMAAVVVTETESESGIKTKGLEAVDWDQIDLDEENCSITINYTAPDFFTIFLFLK